MSEDRRSKGMDHSLIGKPSLRVVLVMCLLMGLCSLLLLAACGGENSANAGADQEHNKSSSAGTAPTDGQMGAPAVVLLPTVGSPLAATPNTVSPNPQSSR